MKRPRFKIEANVPIFAIATIIVLGGLLTATATAYVSSSTNYVLQNDSVNFGGNMSSSSQYKEEDTLGEIATGNGTSSDVNLYAGYQAMQPDTYITITAPADVALSPAIDGMKGGVSDGQASWYVETNNAGGYSLLMKADASPAMGSFNDYHPGYSNPDFSWSTPVDDARFGFSPSGPDIYYLFRDNSNSCGTGSGDSTLACWDGFSTSNKIVASADGPNEMIGGATTTINFRAELGKDKIIKAGAYQANIIVTAITL